MDCQNEIEKEYKTKLKNTSQEEKSDITLKYKQALKELEKLKGFQTYYYKLIANRYEIYKKLNFNPIEWFQLFYN